MSAKMQDKTMSRITEAYISFCEIYKQEPTLEGLAVFKAHYVFFEGPQDGLEYDKAANDYAASLSQLRPNPR